MLIGVEEAYVLCSRLAGVGLIVSSAEQLSLLHDFGRGGAYDSRVTTVWLGAAATHVTHALATRTEFLVLALVARLSAGLVLLLSSDTTALMTASWTLTVVTMFYIRWRYRYGGEDGSDQMMTIMSVAFAASLLLDFDKRVAPLGIYFIGSQACLAYVTSGTAKLVSPQWRSGLAIRGVLATRTYGMTHWANSFQTWLSLALAVCWATIVLQTAFIFAPILPETPLLILCCLTAVFHALVAVIMGLNGFFWSFVATYPAIIYLNQAVTTYLSAR